MEISFELSPHLRADKRVRINIRVFKSLKDRKTIGTDILLFPEHWDKTRQRVRSTHPNYLLINKTLADLYNSWEAAILENPDESLESLMPIVYSSGSLTEFIDFYYKKCKAGEIKKNADRMEQYRRTGDLIKEYEKEYGPVLLKSIDKVFYDQLVGFMDNVKQYEPNTASKYISNISFLMDEAREFKHKVSDANSRKWWKATRILTDAITLTDAEMAHFISVKVPKHLRQEQIRFTMSYYLLLRYGDSISIDLSNFEQDGDKWTFVYRQEKTDAKVRIPVSGELVKMLKEFDFGNKLHYSSKSNEHVKEIARLAGIKSRVNVNGVKDEKWKFVTTHTARRSGATSLALQEVPIKWIMRIGGWSKESTLYAYIRMSAEDLEMRLKDVTFFK